MHVSKAVYVPDKEGKAMATAKNMMKHAALILTMIMMIVMSGAIRI